MYALDHAANHHKVQFTSISNGSAGSSGGSSASGSSASSTAPAGTAFTPMPFTLTFTGGYQDLIRLLTNLEGFTVQSPSGALHVSGRLLTIQSIQLGASSGSSGTPANASAPSSPNQMTWSISASAYVLPSSAAATGATGPSGPAAPAPAGGATPAATPAVVRVGG
jgi:hypothetical protein